MINLDSIINEKNKEHNEKWLYLPDHRYRILIIGGSGSGKANKLLNLIKEQDYHDVTDNIYLYARDLNEPNTMDDVYEDIDKCNPKKDKKSELSLMALLQILWQIENFKP